MTIFDPDPADLRPVAVLDFEASGLGRLSYPIEVAVAFVASGETRTWLIRPTAQWAERGEWDPAAEGVHGITRAELASGLAVARVCAELAAAVEGHVVLSDAVGLDGAWLTRLFAAAGGPPPFALEPFWEAANRVSGVGYPGLVGFQQNPVVDRAVELARERYPREHRAGEDARRLAEILRILGGEPDPAPRFGR